MIFINHIEINGDYIEVENIPKELRFGWKCDKTNKIWLLRLTTVRNIRSSKSNPINNILIQVLQNSLNRKYEHSNSWQTIIIRDPIIAQRIKHLGNLKAFW